MHDRTHHPILGTQQARDGLAAAGLRRVGPLVPYTAVRGCAPGRHQQPGTGEHRGAQLGHPGGGAVHHLSAGTGLQEPARPGGAAQRIAQRPLGDHRGVQGQGAALPHPPAGGRAHRPGAGADPRRIWQARAGAAHHRLGRDLPVHPLRGQRPPRPIRPDGAAHAAGLGGAQTRAGRARRDRREQLRRTAEAVRSERGPPQARRCGPLPARRVRRPGKQQRQHRRQLHRKGAQPLLHPRRRRHRVLEGHGQHRDSGARRQPGARARRGRGALRQRHPLRGHDAQRRRRGRGRRGADDEGRQRHAHGHRRESAHRRSGAQPAPGRFHRRVRGPLQAGGPRHRYRGAQPRHGRTDRDRRAAAAAGQLACGPHCGQRDPPRPALRHRLHGGGRPKRQPDEHGRAGFRPDRGRRRDRGGRHALHPAPAPCRQPAHQGGNEQRNHPFRRRHHEKRRLRPSDHPHRVRPHLRIDRRGGKDVPPHGLDRQLRHHRGPALQYHLRALGRLPLHGPQGAHRRKLERTPGTPPPAMVRAQAQLAAAPPPAHHRRGHRPAGVRVAGVQPPGRRVHPRAGRR